MRHAVMLAGVLAVLGIAAPAVAQIPTRGPNSILEWDQPATSMDGTPLNDLAGWAIHIQSTPGAGRESATSRHYSVPASSPNVVAPITKSVRLGDLSPKLANGTTFLCVTSLDLIGNESSCSVEISFPFDAVAPQAPSTLRTR